MASYQQGLVQGRHEVSQRWMAYDYTLRQILAKALDFPWFKDDQVNFPGATEADGVFDMTYTSDMLAEMLAKKYEETKNSEPGVC